MVGTAVAPLRFVNFAVGVIALPDNLNIRILSEFVDDSETGKTNLIVPSSAVLHSLDVVIFPLITASLCESPTCIVTSDSSLPALARWPVITVRKRAELTAISHKKHDGQVEMIITT